MLGRLPAHEIEITVESIIRDQLSSRSGVSELLGICLDQEEEGVQKIIQAQSAIQMTRFVQGIIQRIIVQTDSLEIELNLEELCSTLTEVIGIKISPPKETAPVSYTHLTLPTIYSV